VPPEVAEELRRVVLRWQQLPLDRATQCLPQVRRLLDDLAVARVPDLGPAVAMDQLTVLVYDACEAGDQEALAARLVELRRDLS
jgi:hypothetical protein